MSYKKKKLDLDSYVEINSGESAIIIIILKIENRNLPLQQNSCCKKDVNALC